MKKSGYSTSSIPALAPAALLFFGVGLASLLSGMVAVLLDPGLLLAADASGGIPQIGEAAPVVGALFVLGGVSSFVFGAGYVLLPLMAASPVWSRKAVWLHLLVHACGVVWLCFGLVAGERAAVENGGFFVLVGIICFVANLVATASRFNRWEPAQLTLVSAVFWLVISSMAGVAFLIGDWVPVGNWVGISEEGLIVAHVLLYIGGFLWLAFLGAGLKVMTMFGISNRHPGALGWIGFCIINLTALAVIPGLILFGADVQRALALAAAVGGLCYFGEAIRLFVGSRKVADAGHVTILCGYAAGLGLLLWIACGLPGLTEGGLNSWQAAGACVLLAVLGPFLFAIFGAGSRMVPFLVWQLRCLPQLVRAKGKPGFAVPEVGQLSRSIGRVVILLCLLMGFGYLIAGFVGREIVGFQLGMVSTLTAFGFFVYTIAPAIRLWLASDALFFDSLDTDQRNNAQDER